MEALTRPRAGELLLQAWRMQRLPRTFPGGAAYPPKYLDDVPLPLKYVEQFVDPTSALANFGCSWPTVSVRTVAEFVGPRRERGENLEEENLRLRRLLMRQRPHLRSLGTGLAFLVFFSGALVAQLLAGMPLISPSLAWTGVGVSGSAVLLSYLAGLDWEDSKPGGTA